MSSLIGLSSGPAWAGVPGDALSSPPDSAFGGLQGRGQAQRACARGTLARCQRSHCGRAPHRRRRASSAGWSMRHLPASPTVVRWQGWMCQDNTGHSAREPTRGVAEADVAPRHSRCAGVWSHAGNDLPDSSWPSTRCQRPPNVGATSSQSLADAATIRLVLVPTIHAAAARWHHVHPQSRRAVLTRSWPRSPRVFWPTSTGHRRVGHGSCLAPLYRSSSGTVHCVASSTTTLASGGSRASPLTDDIGPSASRPPCSTQQLLTLPHHGATALEGHPVDTDCLQAERVERISVVHRNDADVRGVWLPRDRPHLPKQARHAT